MMGETNTGKESRIRLGMEFRAVSGSSEAPAWGEKALNEMAVGREGETVPAKLISQWKERSFKR